jgi:hypothetical protein
MTLSMPSPDGCAGGQVYLPDPPRCTCGQPAGVHEIKAGVRGRCCSGTAAGPCGCRTYVPEEAS